MERTMHRWNTVRRFLPRAAAVVMLLGTACAAPPRTGYAPRSAEETYVIQTVTAMTDALNAGDAGRFMAKVSTGYYHGSAQLEKRVRAILADRTGLRIQVTVEEIVLDDTKITAIVSWKETWSVQRGGPTEVIEGKNHLVFMRGMGIKLIDQAEDALFGF